LLFHTLTFAVFLVVVFTLYWAIRRLGLRFQNLFLVLASYVFYGWWDYRFLILIFISSLTDYMVGRGLEKVENPGRRKLLLIVSVVVNLGLLGFFKYFDFFIDSFSTLLGIFGLRVNPTSLNFILPVGISFYTFQTLSYTIDVYRRRVKPTRDAIAFFSFVSFFPQLVAGPIERASNLLPQFLKERRFDPKEAVEGLRQILWGLVKKVVVADFVASYVDSIFNAYGNLDGLVLVGGVFLFAIQIYCDFSGYSDIAIGVARLFGFRLMRNFAYPYFSRDIGEFWRRWHISLSSWFRDYVYYPLGGAFGTPGKRFLVIIVTFTLSGFWHGANWTFILWGLLNGLYYLPLVFAKNPTHHKGVVAKGRFLPTWREFFQMAGTFAAVLFGWVLFRSESLSHAFGFLKRMITHPYLPGEVWHTPYLEPILVGLGLLFLEWVQRRKQHTLDIGGLPQAWRWAIYYAVSLVIICFGTFAAKEFIYFQF